ncbi:MAG: SHOCT domain-containing protein [Thiogranum sp.]
MMGDSSGMAFAGGLFMWVFWILLVIIIVAVVKVLAGSNTPPGEKPMELLRKRYARGEIDEQEFERRRRELEH